MFDVAVHEPVTFGSEAPAIGNTCLSSSCFPKSLPLISLIICMFSFIIIETCLICYLLYLAEAIFNMMLGILASAQLKAPGHDSSFDLQSQTDCLQHLILPTSRSLCPSIFQSRDILKLFLHVCETIKLVEACDNGSSVLIMILSS